MLVPCQPTLPDRVRTTSEPDHWANNDTKPTTFSLLFLVLTHSNSNILQVFILGMFSSSVRLTRSYWN